ncbi:hypothetical protein BV898_14808 [Hypsibius exemplaris]|uniref:Thymosin beta n=1 Tax=Hypsibius exemplaris TaxID=2072580 RepID=A0A9X6RK06_HYPEX|nr:hypothetical protein BV898_14808 [Hypsibius exemplaris]
MSTPVASEVLKGEINKVSLKHNQDTVVKGVLPTKEDIQSERQVHDVLRSVESFQKDALAHTATDEKTVLPSADDLKTERVHHSLIQGIESFDKGKLENVETKEPRLPNAIDIEVERHANMPSPKLDEVPRVGPDFKKELEEVKLHPTLTNVKVRLPSESDLKDERSHHDFISGIAGFDKKQLTHQELTQSGTLPSADDLKTERKIHDVIEGVEHFDKKSLHHATPTEKIILPTAADIKAEREGLQ